MHISAGSRGYASYPVATLGVLRTLDLTESLKRLHPCEMRLRMRTHLKSLKLARMSSGTYCVIRDLGLVKGGKGMRHHEVLMTFSIKALRTLINAAPPSVQRRISSHIAGWQGDKQWPAGSRRRSF